jgi:excisionase family DNA binding protein
MRKEDLFNDSFIVGFCDYHDESLNFSKYEWKGCWTCWSHFSADSNFSFLTVKEAAEKYKVGRKTIYRWIREGKLTARLFKMGRINTNLPKKFWAIVE